jgi:hypothetical protein
MLVHVLGFGSDELDACVWGTEVLLISLAIFALPRHEPRMDLDHVAPAQWLCETKTYTDGDLPRVLLCAVVTIIAYAVVPRSMSALKPGIDSGIVGMNATQEACIGIVEILLT